MALDEVEQHAERHERDLPPVQVQVAVGQVGQAGEVLTPVR
ncbi:MULTISPECIES: hypothetical protein [Trueperella]|uniref:Uncharacterized protein n=1 Tax=Trueperella abortisuis TaxID=445930 RepID=A0ABT9PL35_9ACTO|nr:MULTISPECIES: hypothetical protein [Trueperella]MDP9832830.1 hypothetical protein [Trueperella abortisuis]